MRKFTFIVFSIFLIGLHITHGQSNLIADPKNSSITIKMTAGNDLLIPIEVNFINPTINTLTRTITLEIDNTSGEAVSQISSSDLVNFKIINNPQQIIVKAGETSSVSNSFYIFLDRSFQIINDKTIFLKIKDGLNVLNNIKVTIQPSEGVYSLKQYLTSSNELDNVTKVESSNNILTVTGYKTLTINGQVKDIFFKRNIVLENKEVLAINTLTFPWDAQHWKPLPISITTIPFKVRPNLQTKDSLFKTNTTSGITNLGFNLDLVKFQMDRYFSTGNKSTHKFALGFWAAPSVEEMDSIYTGGYLKKDIKSKQLFISTGITIAYTYNDISFVFVPSGWDLGTSPTGKRWVYNGKRWWGFGIAISPKIFSTVLNK